MADVTPPVAKKVPHERVHHGDTFIDDYEWLRDKESPDTLAYLEAENAWTEARTAHLAGLRETIFGEIKARTQETDLSVPSRIGGHWYYGRSVEGQQYGISCRCPATDTGGPEDWKPPELSPDVDVPGEEVLLDVNALAEGHDFFALGLRLVFGWQFFLTGRGKLAHLERTTEFFASLQIPAPGAHALGMGMLECVGGLLLVARGIREGQHDDGEPGRMRRRRPARPLLHCRDQCPCDADRRQHTDGDHPSGRANLQFRWHRAR